MKEHFVNYLSLIQYYEVGQKAYDMFVWKYRQEKYVKGVLVDINYLEAHKNKLNDLRNVAHDYYYWINDKGITDYRLATFMSEDIGGSAMTWTMFLRIGLWARLDDRSIINIGTNNSQLRKFVAYCELLIPKLNEGIRK